ncbi:hypothetical protein [Massilia sp. YMA4]|uniref:hypothetical protein n=1 Tax=Massilia sp. YMA4 TaxID=1593482 RepID=UPI000DD0EF53|nr:hypothetical protein [Massilia sp. YMA4]AXA89766.1 hypothetical protein DPH57_00380 [Massilia sp. YMA4]
MKSNSLCLLIVLAGTLAACAGSHRDGAGRAQPHEDLYMTQTTSSGTSATMDDIVKDMPCSRHRHTHSVPDEQARRALKEGDTQSMSPSMRAQHMAMLGQHCQ